MIQINPDFFKLGGKKTRNKRKKSKPDFRNTIKPNNLKKQLLMKIKTHQKEQENLSKKDNEDVSEFQNDFNTSLDYLQTMIKQKQQKKRFKNKKTRKRHDTEGSIQPIINTEPFNGENKINKENEPQLVAEALRIGGVYAKKRGVAKFEATDSAKEKITYLYRLLVHDKLVQPLAKGQEDEPHMRHKLALWIARQLPADHPLLK